MVESTCFQHTSSHPDKYNNSVDRIISKEEEREDPRRDSSIYLRVQCFHTQSIHHTRTTVFPHAIQQLQVSTVNSIYRINSTTRNTTTTRLIPCHPVQINTRHLPVTAPHASKHSTQQNKAPGIPTALQAHTAQAGFQLILPSRNSILSGSQHPRSPYSSSQAHPYRILPGEIGFISKGQVLYIYAILRSVCSNLLTRIILQEYLFYPEF